MMAAMLTGRVCSQQAPGGAGRTRRMFGTDAVGISPPAYWIASSTVSLPVIAIRPGVPTSPIT